MCGWTIGPNPSDMLPSPPMTPSGSPADAAAVPTHVPPDPAIAPAFPIGADHPNFALALRPGDVLLYSRNSPFNWIIKVKTWSRITHCEVALPHPQSPALTVASRNGNGCGFYAFDPKGLAFVLRPTPDAPRFEPAAAIGWFYANRIYEQGYDWLALINFTYARYASRDNAKQFCSEFAVRFLRKGGLDLFPEQDADTIAPRDLLLSRYLQPVWRSPEEWARYHKQAGFDAW